MNYEMSYFDYVTKYKANATILFLVGVTSGILLTRYMTRK